MGVSGLLPALKASTQQVHIRDYRGKRVAVDSYVWLHRAVLTCAADLCMNVPTTKYVKYFMNRVQELLAAGIVPVLVFDGGKLPAKLAEEESREKRRAHALAVASNLMREGNRVAAADHFAKAVDITPLLAHSVQAAAALLGVEIIVAPYEADAQLAFLSRSGYVDAVISEDSDLLVYGCPEILFKYDSASGMCDRILEREVAACLGFPSYANEDFLKHVALLNGCDYCPGVNNVGIKKAVDLLKELGGDSVVAVNVLRAQGFWIDDKDVHLMKLGILTYRHQVVYNPSTLRLQHLAPIPAGAASADTSFLGHLYDDATAVAVASGKADPITKLPFHPLDESCTCARHFALPNATANDPTLSGGAFKRGRVSLPSTAAPPSRLPSVLSFFKASSSSLSTPPPKSSSATGLGLQVVLSDAADVSPEEPPVVQARSKYFLTAAAGGDGEAAAVPFSARGGASGSLFKSINRGSMEAVVTDQPLVKSSSPRNVIERLKQYRYQKDENINMCERSSPVDHQPSPRRSRSPSPASFQASAPSLPMASSLTPHQRLQAFAYNPSGQHPVQPVEYRPSARASGLKKSAASRSAGR